MNNLHDGPITVSWYYYSVGVRPIIDTEENVYMGITIKPSDFKFKYPKDIPNRNVPKFSGIPDTTPFNRDDLFDIIPMMEAVMDDLGSTDGNVLDMLEDILNEMPRFIETREEVFRYLAEIARDKLLR